MSLRIELFSYVMARSLFHRGILKYYLINLLDMLSDLPDFLAELIKARGSEISSL